MRPVACRDPRPLPHANRGGHSPTTTRRQTRPTSGHNKLACGRSKSTMPSPLPSVNGPESGHPLAFAGRCACRSPESPCRRASPEPTPSPSVAKELPEMWPQCGAAAFHRHPQALPICVMLQSRKRDFSALCVDIRPTRSLYSETRRTVRVTARWRAFEAPHF
jgi:hypothetical protein